MCRTGCPTQDHESYAACLKDTSFHTFVGESHERNSAHDAELSAYRDARKQGIQPATTKMRDIVVATELSNRADAPFDAGTRGFKA